MLYILYLLHSKYNVISILFNCDFPIRKSSFAWQTFFFYFRLDFLLIPTTFFDSLIIIIHSKLNVCQRMDKKVKNLTIFSLRLIISWFRANIKGKKLKRIICYTPAHTTYKSIDLLSQMDACILGWQMIEIAYTNVVKYFNF